VAEENTLDVGPGEVLSEEVASKRLADRVGIEYVDLANFEIDPELFRSIPVDLMFRYNFVPGRGCTAGSRSSSPTPPTSS
jgi:type IV pilus assembly protein PilB